MHKFITTSGKVMWYDMRTNKIGLWNPVMDSQAYQVVRFNTPTSACVNRINMFTVEITQQCNLRCTYCCYSGKYQNRRAHNPKEISCDVLNDTVDFIGKHSDKSADEISVCFYGGEALLAKSKIQYLIDRLNGLFGTKICYSLSTNGLALTESIIDWICSQNKFLVNVTIDGDEAMHDAHRITVNKQGSYKTIINNLSLFKSKYPQQYNDRIRFLSTVYSISDINQLSDIWNDIDVLKGHSPVHIGRIIPNFSDSRRIYDTYETKDKFYSAAFLDVKSRVGSVNANCFNKLISIAERRTYALQPSELTIKTCFQDLFSCFINVDGELYACEKFCDELSIGNVHYGFDKKRMNRMLDAFTERKNKYCQSCWAQRLCRMCLTGLNHNDAEIEQMCNMERDTIELALKYFCDKVDWERTQNRETRIHKINNEQNAINNCKYRGV